jgi:hypothetical protein
VQVLHNYALGGNNGQRQVRSTEDKLMHINKIMQVLHNQANVLLLIYYTELPAEPYKHQPIYNQYESQNQTVNMKKDHTKPEE